MDIISEARSKFLIETALIEKKALTELLNDKGLNPNELMNNLTDLNKLEFNELTEVLYFKELDELIDGKRHIKSYIADTDFKLRLTCIGMIYNTLDIVSNNGLNLAIYDDYGLKDTGINAHQEFIKKVLRVMRLGTSKFYNLKDSILIDSGRFNYSINDKDSRVIEKVYAKGTGGDVLDRIMPPLNCIFYIKENCEARTEFLMLSTELGLIKIMD